MKESEIMKLAKKTLKTEKVQKMKKQVCQQFVDGKQKKDCMTAFDKSFIKSFIYSRQNKV